MEKQLKTNGIILRRIDYGEADQILTILTEDQGKIGIFAKGARRLKSRFLGKLELFNGVQLTYFQGRDLGHLNEIEAQELFNEGDLDLRARGFLFYMAEATNKLVAEGQECGHTYHLLKAALQHFASAEAEGIFYAYLIKLLSSLGFMGDWSKTATGDKLDLNHPYFLSMEDGNLTNDAHAVGFPVSASVIKWVNFMQKESFEQSKSIRPTEVQRHEVFFILKSILSTLLNQPFKSEEFMKLV